MVTSDLFSRGTDRQTDTVLESSYGNMSAHKKFQLKTQNKWLAVDPYMPPRRTGMHNYLCRTDIEEARVISFLEVRTLGVRTKFEFRTLKKKKKLKFLGFHAVVLVKTFPLMYQLLI